MSENPFPEKVSPVQTDSWEKLRFYSSELGEQSLSELFQEDSQRFARFHIRTDNWLFDFSKNRINDEVLDEMSSFCDGMKLSEWRAQYFQGAKINETEDRAVLHTALRSDGKEPLNLEGEDLNALVKDSKKALRALVNSVISGEWKGATGKSIRHVVNIGIGGSDLGPKMAVEALESYRNDRVKVHFVSNVDGHDMQAVLSKIKAKRTLFIVASKSFTTQETMTNAETARQWLIGKLGQEAVGQHFIALSTNIEKATEFGIQAKNVFGFWDWVGGRFSLWSAIGVSIALATSWDCFEQLLQGAHKMDEHFKKKDWKENVPVLMGFLGFWYRNFYNSSSQAIIPYDQRLHRFAAYLQQGEMESNGKAVDRNGKAVNYATCPVIWGEPGTNGQHAFFQLLHQGTDVIPVDFIGVVNTHHDLKGHHEKLLANLLAQSQALMTGKDEQTVISEFADKGKEGDELANIIPHKVFQGNRPSTMLMLKELSPETLGELIAMYEHKIFVQGIFWNLFSYDQWGVQLGKELAGNILPALENQELLKNADSSTNGLMQHIFDVTK